MDEPSIQMVKLLTLVRVNLVPISRSSVLLLLSLRKFEVNQDLISLRQRVREEGGRVELGFVEM